MYEITIKRNAQFNENQVVRSLDTAIAIANTELKTVNAASGRVEITIRNMQTKVQVRRYLRNA